MTLYLDTSLIVAALTREAKTVPIVEWMACQGPGELAVSDWVMTEFSAALSTKLRTGQITTSERATALAAFARLLAESLELLPISGFHFRLGAQLADQDALALRGGAALHLALCAGHGATLCTLDVRLAAAAPPVGVRTVTF